MNHQTYTTIVIIALILLAVFRRVRRNIGWQKLKRGNLVFRTVLFLIIGLLFLAAGVTHPISLVSDILGILLGAILGFYGITLTRFEERDGRLYYCPNIWIGSIVTVIFLGRFIYRFYGLFTGGTLASMQQGQTNGAGSLGVAMGNSWTSGLLLIMFAYYAIYYTTLLKKQKLVSN